MESLRLAPFLPISAIKELVLSLDKGVHSETPDAQKKNETFDNKTLLKMGSDNSKNVSEDSCSATGGLQVNTFGNLFLKKDGGQEWTRNRNIIFGSKGLKDTARTSHGISYDFENGVNENASLRNGQFNVSADAKEIQARTNTMGFS